MRRECPAAWDLTLREARAGLRRHGGTPRGEAYQRVIAHYGEGDYEEPSVYERTLGDLLTPNRPGRMQEIVNAVTRDAGIDAADWGVARLLSMSVTLEAEAQQQAGDAP